MKLLFSVASMNYPSLPDLVVEKIIHYAALAELIALKKERFNSLKRVSPGTTFQDMHPNKTWMMILHKYGQVSRHWKSVIFQSKNLFDTEKKRLLMISEVMDNEGSQLRQMVKEGYMERASKMELLLYGDSSFGKMHNDMETLSTIRNAAHNSSIEAFDLYAHDEGFRKTRSMNRERAEHLKCFIDILKLNKKCKTLVISLGWIKHQKDAEVFFDCLLALLKIETLTNIRFDTGYGFNHGHKRDQGRTFLVPDCSIDWDFIKRRGSGDTKIDHIEKVLVCMMVPTWSLIDYEYEFTYDRSDALTLSDFISKVHGKFY